MVAEIKAAPLGVRLAYLERATMLFVRAIACRGHDKHGIPETVSVPPYTWWRMTRRTVVTYDDEAVDCARFNKQCEHLHRGGVPSAVRRTGALAEDRSVLPAVDVLCGQSGSDRMRHVQSELTRLCGRSAM